MRLLFILLSLFLVSCGAPTPTLYPPVMASAPPPPPPPMPMAVPMAAPMPMPVTVAKSNTQTEVTSTKPVAKSTSKSVVPATDSITQSLFKAAIAFVIPDSANIKDEIKAQLLIDPSKEANILSKELRVKGKVTEANIKISRIAVAKIVAPDFDIAPITPEQQALTMNEATEWLWKLTPKTAGSHDIQLTITAIVNVDGTSSEHSLKTFEKTMVINITPEQLAKSWFEQYWQWLVSTLLLPLAIWIYKEKIKKKDT